jgi:hypothetical protein
VIFTKRWPDLSFQDILLLTTTATWSALGKRDDKLQNNRFARFVPAIDIVLFYFYHCLFSFFNGTLDCLDKSII